VTAHNEIHYGVQFTQAIAKAVGLGDEEGVIRLAETLTPIIDVWSRPEWAFLIGDRLCAVFRNEGAVAGEFSAAALVNPAASGILVVCDAASFDHAGVGTVCQLQMQTEAAIAATLLTSAKGNVRDRRGAVNSGANILSGSDASSGIGVSLEERRSPGNETIDFKALPVILPPGFGLIQVLILVNTGCAFNFVWRERKLLPGELRAP
jgi:hypothetical protein